MVIWFYIKTFFGSEKKFRFRDWTAPPYKNSANVLLCPSAPVGSTTNMAHTKAEARTIASASHGAGISCAVDQSFSLSLGAVSERTDQRLGAARNFENPAKKK